MTDDLRTLQARQGQAIGGIKSALHYQTGRIDRLERRFDELPVVRRQLSLILYFCYVCGLLLLSILSFYATLWLSENTSLQFYSSWIIRGLTL